MVDWKCYSRHCFISKPVWQRPLMQQLIQYYYFDISSACFEICNIFLSGGRVGSFTHSTTVRLSVRLRVPCHVTQDDL